MCRLTVKTRSIVSAVVSHMYYIVSWVEKVAIKRLARRLVGPPHPITLTLRTVPKGCQVKGMPPGPDDEIQNDGVQRAPKWSKTYSRIEILTPGYPKVHIGKVP